MRSGGAAGDLATAALTYAARGWAVVPLHSVQDGRCTCREGEGCASPGKHPRTRHGVHDASSDGAVVARWWTTWPTANVGIATGAVSGLVVVDVDPRKDGWEENLAALEAARGSLPSTLTAETGGGGWHHLYRYPSGGMAGSKPAGVDGGVDVLSDGQLFVAAPSLHASGSRYRMPLGDAAPELGELPDRWIVGGVRRRTSASQRAGVRRTGAMAAGGYPWVPMPDPAPEAVVAALRDATSPRQYRAYTAGLHAAWAGLTPSEYVACVRESPVWPWVQEEGEEALARQVEAAYATVAAGGGGSRQRMVDEVWAHAAAADAAVGEWLGRDGRRLYRVLWNLRRRALDMGGGKFPASLRDLAEVGPEGSRSVLSRSIRKREDDDPPGLVEKGWLRVVQSSAPGQVTADGQGVATVYRLTIPPPFRGQGHNLDRSYARLGYVPASGMRTLMGHAAVRREALGVRVDTFRLLLVHGPKTVADLRKLTGLGSSTQYDHVRRLGPDGFGLIAREGDRWAPVAGWLGMLDRIAEDTGATAARLRQRERDEVDRRQYRDYLVEHHTPAGFCSGCGQGLYVAGVDRCRDCATVADTAQQDAALVEELALADAAPF